MLNMISRNQHYNNGMTAFTDVTLFDCVNDETGVIYGYMDVSMCVTRMVSFIDGRAYYSGLVTIRRGAYDAEGTAHQRPREFYITTRDNISARELWRKVWCAYRRASHMEIFTPDDFT